MKIPTQKIQICVGIFLQHYTFLQKRTFSILCENFSRFVRKATTNRPKSDTIAENAKGGGYGDRKGRCFVSQKIYGQQTERTEKKYIFPNWYRTVKINADYPP